MDIISPIQTPVIPSVPIISRSAAARIQRHTESYLPAEQEIRRAQNNAILTDLLTPAQQNELIYTAHQIETLALSAAEFNLTVQEREQIQTQVDEQTNLLRLYFEELAADELRILAAEFQNQSVDFTNGNQSDPFSSAPDPSAATDSLFIESLLQLDVTSQQGLLQALSVTQILVQTLAVGDTESDILEVLLDSQTNTIYYSTLIGRIHETEETQSNSGDGQDSDLTDETAQATSEDQAILDQTQPLQDFNQLNIIEFTS